MARRGPKPGPETHGLSGYANRQCRCKICRRAWADWNNAYKARKLAAGLCRDCLEPAAPFSRCEKHRAAVSAAHKRWKARQAAKGA